LPLQSDRQSVAIDPGAGVRWLLVFDPPAQIQMQKFDHRRNELLKEEADFMAKVKSAFNRWDEESKGFLTREQAKLAVISLTGNKPCRSEMHLLCGAKTEPISVDLHRFSGYMRDKYSKHNEDDDIRQAFKAFDRFSAGFLTLADVKAAFKEVAPKIHESQIDQIFFVYDDDRDGRINYAQFWRMWHQR
jgi:Ca2+-binding EF-hand superfamily protein